MNREYPPVDILLATYNGARYLPTQLDSLLAQDYPSLRILARDDGSSDPTLALLQSYQARTGGKLRVIEEGGPSGGPKGNFAILMRHSTAPYVAFSDQDDMWFPDKVRNTMRKVQRLERSIGADKPVLVFTNLTLADAELRPKGSTFWEDQIIHPEACHSLARLLRQNVVTGCTMIANRALVELGREMPALVHMHDWWLALLACAFGAIDYLDEPTVLYRVHGTNACGLREVYHGLPKLAARMSRAGEWDAILEQVRALHDAYGDRLPPGKREMLAAVLRTRDRSTPWRNVYTILRHRVLHGEMRRNLALLMHFAIESRLGGPTASDLPRDA